jgi:OOP family OmpA-OmpF porin
MAVSQYLRPGNLIDAVKGYLTPEVVRNASSLVGESESSTRQTLNTAVPTVLSGFTNLASSPEGASSLVAMVRDGGFGSAVDNASSLFSGGNTTSSMMNVGQQLLGKIFGNKGSAVCDLVGRSGGVKASSATSLMGLAAPLALGVLGKRAAAQGLDSSTGLANMLMGEKDQIAAAAPSGLSQLLGGGPTAVPSPPRDVETRREPRVDRTYAAEAPRRKNWLPILLIALAALALLMFARGRRARLGDLTSQAGATLAKINLPGGINISVPAGSMNYQLASFLGDTSARDLPKTFVFDHLNFDSGTTRLTPDSTKTVADLAVILKAYPNAQVQLVGHTDNTGSPQANQQLSMDRANAIKGMLVNQGVGADRISTAGYGQERPIASNDTEDGRAKNRRIELNVTQK